MKRIYLDYAAGRDNPNSIHTEGVKAKRSLEEARKKIAGVLRALPDEIIFTSGATEANNLAIFGVVTPPTPLKIRGARGVKPHVITTAIEHHSVLEPIRELEKRGNITVTYLPVSSEGVVDLNALKKSLKKNAVLVSVMYANNEIGTIQPIREIAKIIRHFKKSGSAAKRPGRPSRLFFHVDAAQAPGMLDLNMPKLGADLASFSAQKFYGPKGIGFLWKRRGVEIAPQIFGGGQERGMRSGTENVAGIVEMAEALVEAEKMREKELARLAKLRKYFIEKLLKIPGTILNGIPSVPAAITKKALNYDKNDLAAGTLQTLPGVVNVSFSDVEGEWVVIGLDAKGIAVSTGSACLPAGQAGTTGGTEASHVIIALAQHDTNSQMGTNDTNRAVGAVRFSFGRSTTKRDLDYVLKILPGILEKGKTN